MFLLLAAKAPNNDSEDEIALAILGVVGAILLVCFIFEIFFLIGLSRALSLCSPRKRTMEPGQVWLNLIPLFNVVWQFITVVRVSESLRREFRRRDIPFRGDDFGQALGITAAALPLVLGICGLVIGLICGIVYWTKIAGYCRRLERDDAAYDDEYEDDYEDDRRRRDGDDDYDRRRDDDDDYDRRRRKEYDDDDRRLR